MKQIVVVALGVLLAGCVPGKATVKLSAENVRSVLKGEVVEVPVHGEVELAIPLDEFKEEPECLHWGGQGEYKEDAVAVSDRMMCAATRALTLLLADGSCVTGGVKVVGTNVVQWATVDTKFLLGTEDAILAASNKVERCNGFFVLNDKGEFDLKLGKCKDLTETQTRIKRIAGVFETVAGGCKCCDDAYECAMATLAVLDYDSVAVVVEGDGKGGFCVEVGGKSVAADQIGKELRCVICNKDEDKKGKGEKRPKLRIVSKPNA